jgi:nucleoid-associated protein YgaU
MEKALLINTDNQAKVPVQFNPEEYTLSKEMRYAQAGVPGLCSPLLQFVRGELRTLDMELFIDTYEAGSNARDVAKQVTGFMVINPATHAPPVLVFAWGPNFSFTCVLSKLSQTYQMFRPDGTPVRVRLKVTFAEYCDPALEAKEVKRETADYSKLHLVLQGETLSGIAGQLYGNAQLWRPIAQRNGIDDPRDLAAGRRLVVPQLPYVDPDTGEVIQ